MAESKGALIAKSMQKHAGRAKEKILQNLGKVDRTADEIFDEHLQNFTRQHQQATRLQKEFNNYIRCIRAVQTASKSLLEAITEVYESSWSGHDLLYVQTQNMEMLWQDFSHKLGDQILIPLNTYSNQFPEMRKKIDKRGRKLVDYDSQRHSFQGLQANAAKRRDDVKVTKGRELLEEAKRTYEILNSELHDELPALHDSRILFLISNLQTLFAAEQLFHSETSKVYSELEAITDKLANESQRGSYNVKKSILHGGANTNAITNNHASPPASPKTHNGNTSPATTPTPTNTIQLSLSADVPASPFTDDDGEGEEEEAEKGEGMREVTSTLATTPTPTPLLNGSEEAAAVEPPHTYDNTHQETTITPNATATTTPTPAATPASAATTTPTAAPTSTSTPSKDDPHNITDANPKRVEELYDIPVGATLSNLPPGVLYRVRATYRYTREDQDELSFEVGDVIRVVEYEDPEEQEEGWLMGLKEGSTEKGMFPANFTRPI